MNRNLLRLTIFYTSRIVAVLVTICVLIAIVWFVAKLADNTEKPASEHTGTTGTVERDQKSNNEAGAPAESGQSDDNSRGRRQADGSRRDRATAVPRTGPTTDQGRSTGLPSTGPKTVLSLLAIPVFIYTIIRYRGSVVGLNRRLSVKDPTD